MTFRFIGKAQCPITYSTFHKHPTWELIYNVRGSGTMLIDGQAHPFFPGSIILCPPESLHCKQAQEPFEDYYLTFATEQLQHRVYSLADMNDEEILHILKAIYSAYHKKLSSQVTQDLFRGLMGMLDPRHIDVIQDRYVQMLRQKIISEFTNPSFNLRDACRQIPQNIDHLRRNFKREIGMTPHQYLTELRIHNAKQILAESTDIQVSVSDVAYRCGYSDPLYFSKVFRDHTGCSPTKWQE